MSLRSKPKKIKVKTNKQAESIRRINAKNRKELAFRSISWANGFVSNMIGE